MRSISGMGAEHLFGGPPSVAVIYLLFRRRRYNLEGSRGHGGEPLATSKAVKVVNLSFKRCAWARYRDTNIILVADKAERNVAPAQRTDDTVHLFIASALSNNFCTSTPERTWGPSSLRVVGVGYVFGREGLLSLHVMPGGLSSSNSVLSLSYE